MLRTAAVSICRNNECKKDSVCSIHRQGHSEAVHRPPWTGSVHRALWTDLRGQALWTGSVVQVPLLGLQPGLRDLRARVLAMSHLAAGLQQGGAVSPAVNSSFWPHAPRNPGFQEIRAETSQLSPEEQFRVLPLPRRGPAYPSLAACGCVILGDGPPLVGALELAIRLSVHRSEEPGTGSLLAADFFFY